MSIQLFKVEGKEIKPTDEVKLENDQIYIIIDKHMKRPKIWVWSGNDSNIKDRYFAGVSATKIKSKERLYGASIEVVESGKEPENFPILSSDNIAEPAKLRESLKAEITKDIEDIDTFTEADLYEMSEKVETVIKGTKTLLEQKSKALLIDISKNLNSIVKKINNFLDEM